MYTPHSSPLDQTVSHISENCWVEYKFNQLLLTLFNLKNKSGKCIRWIQNHLEHQEQHHPTRAVYFKSHSKVASETSSFPACVLNLRTYFLHKHQEYLSHNNDNKIKHTHGLMKKNMRSDLIYFIKNNIRLIHKNLQTFKLNGKLEKCFSRKIGYIQ